MSSSKPSRKRFAFVDVTHPSQLASRDVRRQVKRHVATELHRQRWFAEVDEEEELRARSQSSKATSEWNEERSGPQIRVRYEVVQSYTVDVRRGGHQRVLTEHPHETPERSPHPRDESYDLGVALAGLGTNISGVVDHYAFICDAQASNTSEEYARGMRQRVRNFWIPFLMADPASAHVTLLLSVMSKIKLLSRELASSSAVIRLHGLTIQAVQQALNDPRRATTDHTIVCVANMAIHEAIHGHRETYHIHWQALMRMIHLRGGIKKLGNRSEQDIDRIVVWYDAQCSSIMGIPPHYAEHMRLLSEPAITEEFEPVEEKHLETFSSSVLQRVSGVDNRPRPA